MGRIVSLLSASALLVAVSGPAAAEESGRCPGSNRSKNAAMWLSIAHPGLGEWFLKKWGSFDNAPQKKFWLGFIPFYGWPGYLQVRSAIDARRCETHDRI